MTAKKDEEEQRRMKSLEEPEPEFWTTARGIQILTSMGDNVAEEQKFDGTCKIDDCGTHDFLIGFGEVPAPLQSIGRADPINFKSHTF